MIVVFPIVQGDALAPCDRVRLRAPRRIVDRRFPGRFQIRFDGLGNPLRDRHWLGRHLRGRWLWKDLGFRWRDYPAVRRREGGIVLGDLPLLVENLELPRAEAQQALGFQPFDRGLEPLETRFQAHSLPRFEGAYGLCTLDGERVEHEVDGIAAAARPAGLASLELGHVYVSSRLRGYSR